MTVEIHYEEPIFHFSFPFGRFNRLIHSLNFVRVTGANKNARKLQSNYSVNIFGLWLFVGFFFFFRPTIGVWTVLNWLLRFDSQKSSALFVLIRVSLLCSSQRVYRQHEGQFGRGTSPLERAGSEHL